jgi:hypothetical protein
MDSARYYKDLHFRHDIICNFQGITAITLAMDSTKYPDRKSGINLIPSRYHWDQLDAKVIVIIFWSGPERFAF